MEKLKYGGHIKVFADDKLISEIDNTVTKYFEELVATVGIETVFNFSSPIQAGRNFAHILNPTLDNTTNTGRTFNANMSYMVTVYLLNLSTAEKAALTNESYVLPIYDSEGKLDDSKVVGFANCFFTADTPKRGYVEPLKDSSLVNFRLHGMRFNWQPGVLSGTYNCIAVGNYACNPAAADSERFYGTSIYRALEIENPADTENQPTGYYFPAGVHTENNSVVITADDEILLGNSDDFTKARRVLNISTGAITNLEASDSRYGITLLDGAASARTFGVVGKWFWYSVYNSSTNNNITYYKEITSGEKFESYSSLTNTLGLFEYNTYIYGLYISSSTVRDNIRNGILRAYTKAGMAYTSSQNKNMSAIHLPASFDGNCYSPMFAIRNFGNNYLVHRFYPSGKSFAFECSNLLDLEGSIVRVIPALDCNHIIRLNGKIVGFTNAVNSPDTKLNAGKTVYPTKVGGSVAVENKSMKMTVEPYGFGNLYSFHVFEQDQQIPEGQGIHLEYYYTFEQ